jgi:transketolase
MRHLRDFPSPTTVPFGASLEALSDVARDLRYQIVQLSHEGGAAHLGSALSCVDILVAAYWRALRIDPARPEDPNRDRFILSKGHAASALYATLAARGFFPESLLDGFARAGSPLGEQPAPKCAPGVELATGSLGHGLPVGIGMAMAARLQKRDYRVFAVLSDGECNEGSVWEAAMFAPAQRLGRLIVVIDYNKWQATGRSNEVMSLRSLADKWSAFGWNTREVNGHDLGALVEALSPDFPADGPPTAIIAHTVKGRGVSFMEDDNNWHYRIPTAEEVMSSAEELAAR